MRGMVGQAARALIRVRPLSALLLCGLTFWFANAGGAYQGPGPLSGLTILMGVILFLSTALLLARRLASATPSEVSVGVLETLARYAPLVVLNLIAVNVLAPVIALIASSLVSISIIKAALTLLGWMSGKALFVLFFLAVLGIAAVAAMRLVEHAARRWPVASRIAAVVEWTVVGVATAYCAWAMVLTFNAVLDRGAATTHRSEILRVWRIPHTTLWWADVRSWESPRGIKRIFIYPDRDALTPTLLDAGQPVKIAVRPGLFRLPWVERLRLDFERNIDPLVNLAPSAAAPRKWLIAAALRDGRWDEAARQTEIYARFRPGERAYVKQVAAALRGARQSRPAADLERLALSASVSGLTR